MITTNVQDIEASEKGDKFLTDTSTRLSISNLLDTSGEENVLDFANKPKEALDWSNRNFPTTVDVMNTKENRRNLLEINNLLRRKYLNTAEEMYDNPEELKNLDKQFITETSESIMLYANFSAKDFRIANKYFAKEPAQFYNLMLKDTPFGIDHGYFVGSLQPEELDETKGEVIILALKVPAHTKLIRISPLSAPNPVFMLQRNTAIQYTRKGLYDNDTKVGMAGKLMDPADIDKASKQLSKELGAKINGVDEVRLKKFDLVPYGLNAGMVVSNAPIVVDHLIESIKGVPVVARDATEGWELILSSGPGVNTRMIDEYREVYPDPADLREYFDDRTNISGAERGTSIHTAKIGGGEDTRSISNVNFNYEAGALSDTLTTVVKNKINEEFTEVILHEYFHHLIKYSAYFRDSKMMRIDGTPEKTFTKTIDGLMLKEKDKLIESFQGPDVIRDSSEEFMCEAFAHKFYPDPAVRETFKKNVPETNRFLENLFDRTPPTVPQKLTELETTGTSVTFTFEPSTDDIGVDKYIIYELGEYDPIKTIEQPTEPNGPIKVVVDGLKPFTEYRFQVTSIDEALNESSQSKSLIVKTKDTEPPQLQGDLKGKRTYASVVKMSWPQPTDNDEVAKVQLKREDTSSKATKLFTITDGSTFFYDSTLEEGKTYTYTMTAFDPSGNESVASNKVVLKRSDEEDEKDKDKNKDQVQNITSTHATIHFGNLFSGLSPSGFHISGLFSGLSGGVFGWIPGINSHKDKETTSIDVELTPGEEHIFTIVPLDEDGNPLNEGITFIITAPPNDSKEIKIIDTKQSLVSIQWTNTNDLERLKGRLVHDIYRGGQLIATVDGEATTFSDQALKPATSYDYEVFPRVGKENRALKSPKVQGTTLAPYHNQLLCFNSVKYPEEVLRIGDMLGTEVYLQPFTNDVGDFIEISYDAKKQAYQFVNRRDRSVMSVDEKNPMRIISSENKQLDHQFWRIIDAVEGGVRIESYSSSGKVMEVGTEKNDNKRTLTLQNKDTNQPAQRFKEAVTDTVEYEFRGGGTLGSAKMFANIRIMGNKKELRVTQLGESTTVPPSHDFENQTYAAILIQDKDKNVKYWKDFIGDTSIVPGKETVKLEEGDYITTFHQEASHLSIMDRKNNESLSKEQQSITYQLTKDTLTYVDPTNSPTVVKATTSNPVTTEDSQVSGTAVAGSTIVVRTESGKELGRSVTDQTGRYEVRLSEKPVHGSKLSVSVSLKESTSVITILVGYQLLNGELTIHATGEKWIDILNGLTKEERQANKVIVNGVLSDDGSVISKEQSLMAKELTGNLPQLPSNFAKDFTHLEKVNFPNATKIGNNAFEGTTGINEMAFPLVQTIGTGAFKNMSTLTRFVAPKAKSIGDNVFVDAVLLTDLQLPEVTTIGNYCFTNTPKMEVLNLPKVSILSGQFLESSQKKVVVFDPARQILFESRLSSSRGTLGVGVGKEQRVEQSSPETVSYNGFVFINEESAVDFVSNIHWTKNEQLLPNATTGSLTIKEPAEADSGKYQAHLAISQKEQEVYTCSSGMYTFQSDYVPTVVNGVLTIQGAGEKWIDLVSQLTPGERKASKVVVNGTLAGDGSVIPKDRQLAAKEVTGNLVQLPPNFASGFSQLEKGTFPNATTIGNSAFSGATSLKEVQLPEVKTIGINAFYQTKLSEVTLPKVESISQGAFYEVTTLRAVSAPKLKEIKDTGAFEGTSMTELTFPE
ncbi:leucine-rich repeat protein, partial [Enterococcus rivorum]